MIDRLAVEQHAAFGLADEAGHDPQQGRLAAAGRAQQRHQFAAGDIEIDVAHGDEIVESLRDVVERQPVAAIRRHDEGHATHDPTGPLGSLW